VKPAPINEVETKKQKKQKEGMKKTGAGEEWYYMSTITANSDSVVSENCDRNGTRQNLNTSIGVFSFVLFV
jgi:hypothetical protein